MRAHVHHRLAAVITVLAVTLLAASTSVSPGRGEPGASAGALELRAALRIVSSLGSCPPGVTAGACAARTGAGVVPGLGRVTVAYTWLADLGPPACESGSAIAVSYDVRLVVAAKGEIHVAVSGGSECVTQEAVRTQAQAFTITGGSGLYAGASGRGVVERRLGQTAGGAAGTETWRGTLDVPAREFDVVPPRLSGPRGKTVRAPRTARWVRVTYRVTAQDAVDGAVPVSCRPRSGARFKIGRTVVACSAVDTSGNTATARFAVTVRARR
jgi:hypothetical protein